MLFEQYCSVLFCGLFAEAKHYHILECNLNFFSSSLSAEVGHNLNLEHSGVYYGDAITQDYGDASGMVRCVIF